MGSDIQLRFYMGNHTTPIIDIIKTSTRIKIHSMQRKNRQKMRKKGKGGKGNEGWSSKNPNPGYVTYVR